MESQLELQAAFRVVERASHQLAQAAEPTICGLIQVGGAAESVI